MSRLRSERSKEAPMDFQFTDRPTSNVTPAWASPQKRPHEQLATTLPDLTASPTPRLFGQNQNHTFLFNQPPPHTEHAPAWAPPTNFSPTKAFPLQPDVPDVDMADVSPKQVREPTSPGIVDGVRTVATGALRRVYNARRAASPHKGKALAVARRTRRGDDSRSESGSESESDEDAAVFSSPRKSRALQQTTSHHYTLNLPSPAVAAPDTPYILLGYLQFFFNLSLILLFLYLAVQFIFTVQRDVEQRISEYSMDIVQEISNCAIQFRTNGCGANPVPAMVRQCGAWDTCMNRDPTIVGRARVGAELIAEVVNSFVEPISWKTLDWGTEGSLCFFRDGFHAAAFTLSSLAFMTIFINTLLSLYRARLAPAPAPLPSAPPPLQHQPSYGLPPATPFAHAPYLQNAQWAPPEAAETPRRRRRLDGSVAAKVS